MRTVNASIIRKTYLRTKSPISTCVTGLSTNRAALGSRPLCLRMKVRRASRAGSSVGFQISEDLHKKHITESPNIRLLAISTTVSLMDLSLVIFFLCAISADSSVSLRFSSTSLDRSCSALGASKGDRFPGLGNSYIFLNNTKTDGTRVVCFRIQIGAMRPSGYRGEDGVNGERGE